MLALRTLQFRAQSAIGNSALLGIRNLSLTSSKNAVENDAPVASNTAPKIDKEKSSAKRGKTPLGKLDELEEGRHPYQEKEPLPPWPNNTNPHTGEIGGPRGPEPTRYGDWERKGRVSDF